MIPRGTSPEPGRWRTSRVPYLREILDAVSDPTVERVVVMAASQVGKTEILLCVIGYYADQDPAPILLVQPTEQVSRAFAKERVDPMFHATPTLRGKLGESQRDPDNTILLKQFPGGMLAMAWSTSPASLASRPIRVVLLDEIDRYPESIGKDGDPIAQAVQRTANFPNRKVIAVSTPTIDGVSQIQTLHDETTQYRCWLPCPHCGAYQVLEWGGLKYKTPDGEVDLEDVHYLCAHCAARIEEHHRPAMLAACEWRADEERDPRRRGYHLSSLLSPWVRWRDLAEQWVGVHKKRDQRGLQEFINLRLGESYVLDVHRVNADDLDDNREDYEAELPEGVLLLTAGVDVQDNRLEAEVVGWGRGRESWGIRYEVIVGDTSAPDVWHRLDEFLAKTWAYADGSSLGLWCACVDSGGHRTEEVYSFTRDRLPRNIFAVKGKGGPGLPIAGKATTANRFRIPLIPVGVDAAKDALMSRLKIREPGPGYCHFPRDARTTGYDREFFPSLCSERREPKIRAGRRVMVWVQKHQRNEALDCRVYATAAMELLAPDFEALAARRAAATAPASARPSPTAPKPRRRMLSRGVI